MDLERRVVEADVCRLRGRLFTHHSVERTDEVPQLNLLDGLKRRVAGTVVEVVLPSREAKLPLAIAILKRRGRVLEAFVFQQAGNEFMSRVVDLGFVDLLFLARQHVVRLQFDEPRRDVEKVADGVDVDLLKHGQDFEILVRDDGERDVEDVEFVLAHEIEEQVERTGKNVELDAESHGRDYESCRRRQPEQLHRTILLPRAGGRTLPAEASTKVWRAQLEESSRSPTIQDVVMDYDRLWAPWRLNYIAGDASAAPAPPEPKQWHAGADRACFLCRAAAMDEDDQAAKRELLIVARGANSVAVLNRFPYNNGHLLVSPLRHVADLADLTPDEHFEAMAALVRFTQLYRRLIQAEGFNAGVNLGRVAGAGVPGHLHWHLVPRWAGDNNFMPATAATHIISQSLESLWEAIAAAEG